MKTMIPAKFHLPTHRYDTSVYRRLLSLVLLLVLVVPLMLQLAGCSKKPVVDPDLADLAIYDVIEYEIGDQYS
ncbi:MAG: hypothetical protein EOM08_12475, partial [Clostridia bacterium]|nr:hypothetical protein [Clostridia bacterium]